MNASTNNIGNYIDSTNVFISIYKYLQYIIQIFQNMNFAIVTPQLKDYNKIMMQRHLDQKRQRKHNISLGEKSLSLPKYQSSRLANTDSLPLAGQTLISQINNNSTFLVNRKKQVNEQNEKMKKLLKERLQESLAQQKDKKYTQMVEQKKNRKIMSTENGMLDYLEKQIQKRDNFIKMCLVKQELNKNKFVDDDMRKHRKVLQHIEQNYDANVFNHESDRYQMTQKINFQRMLEINHNQAQNQRASRIIQKSQYGKYLQQKSIKQRQRHNPITNPMEYHIQNPYLKRQLQKY